MDRYEALERLAKLKEQGIISDQEFILEKHAILSSPTQSGARFPPSADLSGGFCGAYGPGALVGVVAFAGD